MLASALMAGQFYCDSAIWSEAMQAMKICLLSLLSTAVLAQDIAEPVALNPRSDNDQIVQHLVQHELNQTQTDALAIHFPDMTRERAYAVQRQRLKTQQQTDKHVGWKLGWTRLTESAETLDPILGHYMSARVYAEGDAVSTRYFTEGTANAEPEIVFYLKKDLVGPVVSRDEVIDAIESVGVAMEFVNWRVTEPRTREHAIADNGIAAGVVLAGARYSLEEIDFSSVTGTVTVNDSETSSGAATSIMGEDPLAALVWAANELPKWGMHLKAGEFIVSGTVCIPLPVTAGDTASIGFTGFEGLQVRFVK